MKFSFNDREKMISHWILQDIEVAQMIGSTPEFQKDHTTIAKITVNGVELPFESFESYLQHVYKSTVDEAREEFKDLDAEVQRRLEKRMKEEAQPIIDKLFDLREKLEEADSFLIPYYERNN